jgi:hypothetical protein
MFSGDYSFDRPLTAVSNRNAGTFALAEHFTGGLAQKLYGFLARQTPFE